MDENGTERKPDLLQVTLGSSEYKLVPGGIVEVEALIANSGPSDTFIVNMLGIPPSWVKSSSGPSTVWIASGGQERVVLTISTPAAKEGILGSYPGRLYVFAQNAPDKGQEVPFILVVMPPEKTKKTFVLRTEVDTLSAVPGTKLKVPLAVANSSPETVSFECSVEGVPAGWVSLPSPVISLLGGEEKVVDLYLQIPTTPEIRAGNYPLKIIMASQKDPAAREEVADQAGHRRLRVTGTGGGYDDVRAVCSGSRGQLYGATYCVEPRADPGNLPLGDRGHPGGLGVDLHAGRFVEARGEQRDRHGGSPASLTNQPGGKT